MVRLVSSVRFRQGAPFQSSQNGYRELDPDGWLVAGGQLAGLGGQIPAGRR